MTHASNSWRGPVLLSAWILALLLGVLASSLNPPVLLVLFVLPAAVVLPTAMILLSLEFAFGADEPWPRRLLAFVGWTGGGILLHLLPQCASNPDMLSVLLILPWFFGCLLAPLWFLRLMTRLRLIGHAPLIDERLRLRDLFGVTLAVAVSLACLRGFNRYQSQEIPTFFAVAGISLAVGICVSLAIVFPVLCNVLREVKWNRIAAGIVHAGALVLLIGLAATLQAYLGNDCGQMSVFCVILAQLAFLGAYLAAAILRSRGYRFAAVPNTAPLPTPRPELPTLP